MPPKTHWVRCRVEVSPSEVDAGADMILQAKVACSPAADLRGESVLLKDHDGALAGTLEVTAFDGETNETSACVVTAPAVPGAYTWLAVSPGPAAAMSQEEASTPFSLTVKPHSMRVVVWDAPSAIPCGEAFGVKLGVKCSSECRGDGWTVEIYDRSRKKQAAATLGHEQTPVQGARWLLTPTRPSPTKTAWRPCGCRRASTGSLFPERTTFLFTATAT